MVDLVDGGTPFSTFGEDEPNYSGTFSPSTRQAVEVAQSLRRQFGDESGVQLEDSDVLRWINDAQDTIVGRNRVIKALAKLTAIPGVGSYRFPEEDIHQIESLHVGGRYIPNMPFSEAERQMVQWNENDIPEGLPQFWTEWGGQFTLWPTPQTETEIRLYFTKRPIKIGAMSDYLGIPDKYFPDVLRYCLQQAYELDEDFEAAEAKRNQFNESLTAFGEEERTSQNMTYYVIPNPEDY